MGRQPESHQSAALRQSCGDGLKARRFSAKVFVKHERDGHRSGFRPRFPGLSLRDETADPQSRGAGLIGRVFPVELGLIVSHIGAHLRFVSLSKGQNLGDQFRRQLEFLGDVSGDSPGRAAVHDMEEPDSTTHHGRHVTVGRLSGHILISALKGGSWSISPKQALTELDTREGEAPSEPLSPGSDGASPSQSASKVHHNSVSLHKPHSSRAAYRRDGKDLLGFLRFLR